ncbi:1-(5-phosphoribosyl)-5-[(5-phosphoribosylamino)methylideneamino]imidazole-4-carboxamide isomerase [Paracoccaceae bacterium]|nr:1-(5-phosphoribosyl)-5-[(5-phosphoribosylamino)methylideneamino]imidazole-4-carboxamide isomerase [Paracoccaceae bacterium]
MNFYPAIDLKEGTCVRLKQGDFNTAVVYNDDPIAQASFFQQEGCEWLHVVDLDGAVLGSRKNLETIQEIRKSTSLKIQVGGGIRSLNEVEFWKSVGVERVILGTVAVSNPAIVKDACRLFDGILIALDSRANKVATAGWKNTSNIDTLELAKKYEDCGVDAIIYTDIDRDGLMEGLNLGDTKRLSENVSLPVIGSGGINGPGNLESVKKAIPNLEGIIAGKALYTGALKVKDALKILKE